MESHTIARMQNVRQVRERTTTEGRRVGCRWTSSKRRGRNRSLSTFESFPSRKNKENEVGSWWKDSKSFLRSSWCVVFSVSWCSNVFRTSFGWTIHPIPNVPFGSPSFHRAVRTSTSISSGSIDLRSATSLPFRTERELRRDSRPETSRVP